VTAPADFDALELFRALGRHEVEYVTEDNCPRASEMFC
jgi:hypothetical protein